MKKTYLAACVMAAAMFALTGCSGSSSDSTSAAAETTAAETASEEADTTEGSAEETTADAAESADSTASTGKLIEGQQSTSMESIEDAILAVSFEKGDLSLNDDAQAELTFTVYSYDLYDMVDISLMEVGDTIRFCGEDIEISSIDRNDNGPISINGGIDAGGFDLYTDEDTVYYARGWDDMKYYYVVGQAGFLVSEDFVFTDSSDLEKGEQTYYVGDFLTEDSGIEYNFTPNNTTIRTEGGIVVEMNRRYVP